MFTKRNTVLKEQTQLMANQTYRIGIIGCGGMGRSHSRAWSQQSKAQVVAAMDIHEEAAKRVSDEYDVPAIYTDVDEMLAKEDLDIVSITTWQGPRGKRPLPRRKQA